MGRIRKIGLRKKKKVYDTSRPVPFIATLEQKFRFDKFCFHFCYNGQLEQIQPPRKMKNIE